MTAAKPMMLQQLLSHQACVPTAQLKNCFEYSPLYMLASIERPLKILLKSLPIWLYCSYALVVMH